MSFFLKKVLGFLWDSWCAISIIGIWPRYIEPKLLKSKLIELNLNNLPSDLEGLKILHFSDLHLHPNVSTTFLNKIIKNIRKLKPDLILFTGDFICYSQIKEPDRLQHFLNQFHAPYGCYCIFGNHDYAQYVTLNKQGDFDVAARSSLFKGIQLLMRKHRGQGIPTPSALSVPFHSQLCQLLENTPFKLLENTTQTISIGSSLLNICGLGDVWLGRCRPETAFSGYSKKYPGIVLSHNPESFKLLKDFPGDIILSGHTHGEQIHLPGILKKISKRMAGLPKDALSRGLYTIGAKKIYVTHGVGCHKPFRFCSMPEIMLLTLKKAP